MPFIDKPVPADVRAAPTATAEAESTRLDLLLHRLSERHSRTLSP
jgi:hypothetical protein